MTTAAELQSLLLSVGVLAVLPRGLCPWSSAAPLPPLSLFHVAIPVNPLWPGRGRECQVCEGKAAFSFTGGLSQSKEEEGTPTGHSMGY